MIVDNAQIIPKIMVVNFLKYNAIKSENEEINDAYPIFFKISNLDSRSSEYIDRYLTEQINPIELDTIIA